MASGPLKPRKGSYSLKGLLTEGDNGSGITQGISKAAKKLAGDVFGGGASDKADADEIKPPVSGTKRAASTAGYAGTSYKPAAAPEKSAMMSATAKGATSGSITAPSKAYKAAQKKAGDDYLSNDAIYGNVMSNWGTGKKKK